MKCTVPDCKCPFHRSTDESSTKHFGFNSEHRRGNNFNGKTWPELLDALEGDNEADRKAALAAAEFMLAVFTPESYSYDHLGRQWRLTRNVATRKIINIVVAGKGGEAFSEASTERFCPFKKFVPQG